MRSLRFILSSLPFLAIPTLADTEIRNFRFPLTPPEKPRSPNPSFTWLSAGTRQVELIVSSTEPERWIMLDCSAPGWTYDTWTVRLSWPGSSPTVFDLDLLPSSHRQAILHISARPLSPRFTHPLLFSTTAESSIPNTEFTTTFHLVLEPLVLSILPLTAVPTLLCILVFALGSALTVPTLIRLLERAASGAKRTKTD